MSETLTAETLRAAIAAIPDRPIMDPIHPKTYARALEILGLPEGYPLTVGEFYRAAQIESAQMEAERHGKTFSEKTLSDSKDAW